MIALDGHRSSATVLDSQFAENLVEMVLYRVSADPEDNRDFLVGFALTHPIRHLLLTRAKIDHSPSGPAVLDLFVYEQEKTARVRVAREPNNQLARSASERPSALEFQTVGKIPLAQLLDDQIVERLRKPASGTGLPSDIPANQTTRSLAAIAHLAVFAEEDVSAAQSRFDRLEDSRLVCGFEQTVHVHVKTHDANASPCMKNRRRRAGDEKILPSNPIFVGIN
jgi:hypothetical protein